MEGGWKRKHINRGTILYKLLHKFDKLGEEGKPIPKQTARDKKKKRSEHLSEETEGQGQEAEMEIQET